MMRMEKLVAAAALVVAGCAVEDPTVTDDHVDELRRAGEARGAELAAELRADEHRSFLGVVTGANAAIARAVNDGEIAQATLALGRAEDPDVVALAALILVDHIVANERQAKLLDELDVAPVENPVSITLRTQNALAYATLAVLPDGLFDTAYVDSQILVHAQVAVVLRAARAIEPSPAFRAYLGDLIEEVDHHLAEAIRIATGAG